MKKILLIFVSLFMFCLVQGCTLPGFDDTNDDNTNETLKILNEKKSEAVKEVNDFINGLNSGDYTEKNWNHIQTLLAAVTNNINGASSEKEINNYVNNFKETVLLISKKPAEIPDNGDNTGGDSTGGNNIDGDSTGGNNTGGDNTGGNNTSGDNTDDKKDDVYESYWIIIDSTLDSAFLTLEEDDYSMIFDVKAGNIPVPGLTDMFNIDFEYVALNTVEDSYLYYSSEDGYIKQWTFAETVDGVKTGKEYVDTDMITGETMKAYLVIEEVDQYEKENNRTSNDFSDSITSGEGGIINLGIIKVISDLRNNGTTTLETVDNSTVKLYVDADYPALLELYPSLASQGFSDLKFTFEFVNDELVKTTIVPEYETNTKGYNEEYVITFENDKFESICYVISMSNMFLPIKVEAGLFYTYENVSLPTINYNDYPYMSASEYYELKDFYELGSMIKDAHTESLSSETTINDALVSIVSGNDEDYMILMKDKTIKVYYDETNTTLYVVSDEKVFVSTTESDLLKNRTDYSDTFFNSFAEVVIDYNYIEEKSN